MRDQAMPRDRMKGLRMGGHTLAVDGRNDQDGIPHLLSVSSIATDDAIDPQSPLLRFVDSVDEIHTDLVRHVPPADREHKDGVILTGTTHSQPGRKNSFPAVIIRACGQLCNIVDWCVGFNPAEFSEVVDGMTAIRCAPSDAQHKQPPVSRAQIRKALRNILKHLVIDAVNDLACLGEVFLSVRYL